MSLTSTTEKPPKRGGWTTVGRETNSRLPLQKKEKEREDSSLRTQAGMWMREATYQTRERAKALMTRALPLKDRTREHQDLRARSTASILGHQLSSSKFPLPRKTPRIFNLVEDQSKSTGGSEQPTQLPNQRPLDLDWLSLAPEAFSNKA